MLEELVNSLPEGGEWWKDGDRETFVEVGKFLLAKGLSEDDVEYVLEALFYATKSEYGE